MKDAGYRLYTASLNARFLRFVLVAALIVVGGTSCGGAASSRRHILFLSDRDGAWALYTMDTDGTNQQRVGEAGHADPFGQGVGFGEPLISPDGRRALVASRGITLVTLATGASKRIAAGEELAAGWSPDSKRIVFSGPGQKGLYVFDLRSGRRRALLRGSQTWTPSWSPDGKWIVFTRQIGYGPAELYAAHPDGSRLTRLTSFAPEGDGLGWSHDGTLAFIGSRENQEFAHLVLVDVRRRRVTVTPTRLSGGTPAWSPDGRRIAYAAAVGRSESHAIYTVAADGGDRRRLSPKWPPSYDESPVWSPDGRRLLFVRTRTGGGAESGMPEVWAMAANGSHQRQLTAAFPTEGENVEPTWARGAVHAEPARNVRETRARKTFVLRVPFPVNGVSADGRLAAVAPVAYGEQHEYRPTPPILVWRPGRGERARVVASSCGGVEDLVLEGNRLAFDCDQSFIDLVYQSLWVADLRTRVPREVFVGHGGGPTLRGVFLDYIVGDGGLLAFGSERDDNRGRVRQRALWRINGFHGNAVRARADTGDLVAAGGGRLALELDDGRIAIARPNGEIVRVLPLRRRRSSLGAAFGLDPKPPFLLMGRELLLLEHGRLRAYDTASGRLRWERRVPRHARLEGANGGLVAYTAGSSIYLISRGERVVRTGARRLRSLGFNIERPLHADLTAAGLFYCFNVADRRYPGRVVFVPRSALGL